MSATDYRSLYEQYWSRPDRWGSHSFGDARALTDQILTVCGPGRVLDVGCGMGLLVRTLLARGVDALGADVAAACVAHGNAGAPGRFVEGSAVALPFDDNSFETVVSTDVLEHLTEADVDRAIAEMARVARGTLFVRVSTEPDRDKMWHLTVRPREWWEGRFIAAGLRKHPASNRVVPYNALDREGWQITLMFERRPAAAGSLVPKPTVAGESGPSDALSEHGRRSDARIARYGYAIPFVRPGDVVLDAACGMGYGSCILARGTGAARVIGVDSDPGAVAYARACYADDAAAPGTVEFREATLPDLSFLPDRSVDLVACFETLEHVPDPAALLAEFERVLTPGGRLIVSVPCDWTDESGKDPNPHHLHVYTWDRLGSEVSARFLLERAAAQTAGGGMKLTGARRAIIDVTFAEDAAPDGAPPSHDLKNPPPAEWWLAVAMKSPIGADKGGYRESAYADAPREAGYHLTSFGRDYDNPWLVRSIVSIGSRATRPALLRRLAREVIATGRAGSPGVGAALCVLAYQELERFGRGAADAATIGDLLRALGEFDGRADDTPHGWRWRISNRYAAALLTECLGDRAGARRLFEDCASMDCTRFSPLLASKTVDAAFQAGAIAAADGDADGARVAWVRGVREAQRVLSGPWLNVIGDPERPVNFGLPEVAIVAEAAGRCAYALDMLSRRPAPSAQVWVASQTQSVSDLRRWAQRLDDARGWLELEVDRHRGIADSHAKTIAELRAWCAQQDEGRAWLESSAARHEAAAAELRERIKAVESGREELRQWSAKLAEARDWLSDQVKQRDATITELRRWTAELTEGRDWLDGQRRTLAAALEERQREATVLRERNTELDRSRAALERDVAALREGIGARDAGLAELAARLASVEALQRETARRVAELTARNDELDRCLVARERPRTPGVPAADPGASGIPAAAVVESKPAGNDGGNGEAPPPPVPETPARVGVPDRRSLPRLRNAP